MIDLLETTGRVLAFLGPDLDPESALSTDYDSALVALSILIAVFGSYAAFALVEQTRASRSRRERFAWLAGGALALGSGIWTMHFLGMLAWRLPIPVNYDPVLTALSAVPAIGAGAIMLTVMSRRDPSALQIVTGGTFMGAGIGIMHYSGMAAVRMEAMIYYDPTRFALSIAVAVILSTVALRMKTAVVRSSSLKRQQTALIAAAVIMGCAIAIMHYTGMWASFCFSRPGAAVSGAETRYLAITVGLAASFLLAFAILASQVGGRLRVIPHLQDEIETRHRIEQELQESKDALARSHAELETRVEDRTRELSIEIAERKRVEEQLISALRETDRANQLKSQFLSHMSHEFRTPLNGIIGYLELLSTDACLNMSREKIQSVISDIHGAGTHLLSLINNVLDMSRIEAGMEDISPDTINLSEAIPICVDVVSMSAAKKRIDVQYNGLVDSPTITCDPKHFSQVMINLISNAVKYTDSGGTVEIGVTREEDGKTAISVRDNGCGIDEQEFSRVFRAFERSDNAMISTNSGTGLGLPLAKRLAELNNGSISLESELNKGTIVTIRF